MRSEYKVADVLELDQAHLEDYCANSWQLRTLHAIRKCRTVALGGHIDKCNYCNKIHISYNSCRNRHCPTCQGHKQAQWVEKRMDELLPVAYFHVVFTLPSELNAVCLANPRAAYKALFDAAWQTIQAFAKNNLNAKMGMIAILHTWGQNMSLHPHLHCIVPGGGVTKNGIWKTVKSKNKFLFPVKAMSNVFRAKYVEQLRKLLPKQSQKLYDSLFKKNWVAYAKAPFSKAHNVVEYLGRYTHKIAISNHRIVKIDKQNRAVTFRMKDYRRGGKTKVITLNSKEFIRRFSLHILPKGFTRIRHYGILSSSWKREKLPQLQQQLYSSNHAIKTTNKSAKETTKHRLCYNCKKGRLETILIFSKRGPPKWELLSKKLQIIIPKKQLLTIEKT